MAAASFQRKRSEAFDRFGNQAAGRYDFRFGRVAPETDAHRAVKTVAFDAHRAQNMRGFNGAAVAGRTGSDRDPVAQGNEQGTRVYVGEAEIDDVRQTVRRIAIHNEVAGRLQWFQ